MPTSKDLENLVINKVESQAVYDYMQTNNLINEDELYLVKGTEQQIIIDTELSTTSENPVQNKVIATEINNLNTLVGDESVSSQITTAIESKVDKVDGKGLSTNDYTTTEKEKLAGISAGAEVNVQSDWDSTSESSDAFIKNKPPISIGGATYSIVEGYATTAIASYSHAEGDKTVARGNASHAEGHGTIAVGQSQHVEGEYNIKDTPGSWEYLSRATYAHILGNGTSDTNRSNAHTIDWSGNAWFAGDIRVGGTSYDDAISLLPKSTSVTLLAADWTGDAAPYSQVVTMNGVTANSKIDLQPTAMQVVELQNNDISLMIENNDGTTTAYAIGTKPTSDYTMQALITEVMPV